MVSLPRVCLLMARMKSDQRRADIGALQEERLRQLTAHCAAEIPYYEGLDVRSLEDLEGVPFTSKEDVRKDPEAFISKRCGRSALGSITTSGSTGMPLTIRYDGREADWRLALEYHQLTECGVGPFERQAHLTYYSLPEKLPQRLGLFRREYLSFYEDEAVSLAKLKKLRPDVLHCYPSFLVPLAQANRAAGAGFRVKKAFSSAEVLSDSARQLICGSFGCDLRDFYGSTELSWIAWQCEEGSMHLHSDALIAEVVDRKGRRLSEGRSGELVVTPLWKRAMPFIRYRTGDRTAIRSGCPCGRRTERIEPVEGRQDDFIVLPSGRIRSARFVDLSVRSVPGISLYQVVQERDGTLRMRIVPSGSLSNKARQEIERSLRASFPEPVEVELEIAASIPRGPSGKIRSVISRVKPPKVNDY
jgi:phenylacetate-CoA ligase